MQTDWKIKALPDGHSKVEFCSGFARRMSLNQEYQTQGSKVSQVLKEPQNKFQIMGRNWILNQHTLLESSSS